MKLIQFLFILFFLNFSFGQVPVFDWAQSFGGNNQDAIYGSSIDNNGFFYNTGFFSGTADFDPDLFVNYDLTTNGNNIDAFLQKLDANGDLVWAISFGGNGPDNSKSIYIDDNNNIYLTGFFSGTVDFNPGVDTNLATADGFDCFVLKLDEFGGFDWVKTFGGSGEDEGYSISVYQSNVYVTGTFQDSMDINPNNGVDIVYSNGEDDCFVVKLNDNGDYVWGKTFGGVDVDISRDIISNSSGVYLCGHFEETVDFDPSIGGNVNVSSNDGRDIFILKLTHSGNYSWLNAYGNVGHDSAVGLTFDASGNIIITGYFTGNVDFDPNPVFTSMLSSNNSFYMDAFVQKISSSGNHIWAKNIGGTNHDVGIDVHVDAIGNINYTGFFIGQNVDFDPALNSSDLHTATQFEDAFFSKLSSDGNYISTKVVGGSGNDWGGTVVSDAIGNVYFSGHFQNLVDFNPPNNDYFQSNQNTIDAFSIKYTECYVTYDSISITQCGSYVAPDGQTFTNTGIYTATLINSQGCDSLINIDLTINNNSVFILDTNTCASSYMAPDGQVYTTSGLYNAIIPNSIGCDSNIIINLHLNTTYDSIYPVACNIYPSPDGLVYNSSGIYTAIIPNSLGCDSIITIYLTITTTTTSTVLATSCGPYTAPDNNIYFTSGHYTIVLPSANGCDSVIDIYLTVNSIPVIDAVLNQSLCPGLLTNNISFNSSASNTTYTWTNDNQSMGLGASGTGDINSFLTLNNTNINQEAIIIVTPHVSSCSGDADTFSILVYPSPIVDQISNQQFCVDENSADIIFTGGESNCTYSWNNDNSSIGLPLSGTGDISSFLVLNSSASPITSNITVVGEQNGCVGVPMTFTITANVVDVSVTTLNPTLVANAVGAQYQWIDCDENFLPISGETNSNFTSVQSGNYAVIVNQNGCIDTSWCYSLNLILLQQELVAESFKIFPNPTFGEFYIENPFLSEEISVNVLSLKGELVSSNKCFFDYSLSMFLDIAPGVYILELITADKKKFNYRIVKS